MKFQVYQIRLSEQIYNEMDRLNSHAAAARIFPEYKAHLDVTMGKYDNSYLKYYTHVCTIDANDLEQVFEVGNIGPEHRIERHSPMHSLSVGDLVRDADGVLHLCASMGWKIVHMENTPYWQNNEVAA